MKSFIATITILLLSLFLTDGRSSSQGIIVENYIVNTYSESEMLMHYLVSKIKLSKCEVLLLSINQDLEQEVFRNKTKAVSFEEMLHNLDSLDNEIKTSKNY